jgi:hypothetical protein
MKVGNLVKLSEVVVGGRLAKLRGIVLKIDKEGFHKVLWTDGDVTQEFLESLEVVCK